MSYQSQKYNLNWNYLNPKIAKICRILFDKRHQSHSLQYQFVSIL